jgi:putative hydrolase of the HAD superfamily
MRAIPPLVGILFDAGDVIYHRPRRGHAISQYLAEHGLALAKKDDATRAQQRRSYLGEITQREFFQHRLMLAGLTEHTALERGIDIMVEAQSDIELHQGVRETLLALHETGFKLGIVTNTNDPTQRKLNWFRPFGIDQMWSAFATSCELRLAKPDAAIYRAALTQMGADAGDVAFVGHSGSELAGATATGLSTITFNPDSPAVVGDAHAERFEQLCRLTLKAAR